jgi:exonuclease SbcC
VLNRARAVEPLREALRALDALEDDSVSLQSKLNELHESIPSAEAGIAELEARLQCVHPEVEEALLRLERDRDLLENASLRDREIETETNRYRDAVTRYEEIDRLVGEHVKERDRIVQRVPQVESRAAELRSWLDEHSSCGYLQNRIPEAQEILRSLDDTRRRLRDDRARKSDALNEEKQKAGKLDKSQRVTARAREKLNLLEQRRDAADQVLHDLTGNREPKSLHDDLLALQEKLSAYERLMEIGRKYHHLPALGDMDAEMGRMELERDRVAQALSQEEAALGELAEGLKKRDEVRKHNLDRTDLEAGKACPLCGAMDHPYTAGELPDFSDLDRVVHEHEGKIAAFQEELQGLETKLTELRQRSEEADLRRREWTEACLPAGGEWGYSDVNLIEYEAKALRNDISAVKSRIRGSRWRTWKARWDAFVLGRVKDKLFRKEQVEGGIRKEHELLKQELADLDERIRRGEEDERAMLSTLSSGFGMDNEAIASPGTEMDWLQRMVNRSNEYQARRQEMDALDGELGALGSRREQILCELPGFEEEKEALSIEVQAGMSRLSELRAERETLFGDLDPLGRRQALESDIENRRAEQAALNQQLEILREKIDIEQAALPKLKVELQEVLVQFEDDKRRLMERAAASGLQTIQELRTMAAVLDDGENVRKRLAEAEEALNRAVSELAAVRGELESVRAGRSVEESMDTLQAGISEKLERRLALQEGIEEAEGLMKERARADAEHRGLLQAIAVQERICSEALAEQEKLQPANAAQTESRLQHLLLERLVGHTNKHLAFLSDRYTLQLAGETGLGLHVEDSHQRLTHRSAGTLSGGETFLVSLCLALGLSDMAAMNHRIESLFLDEGFGSLDEEMLYKVIATLKALDRYGMQVGVVSHVKRLGDEISTQIKVTREPTGFSSIKILP